VPPIFEPELAAEAIVYAAQNPRGRELFAGRPTVKAVVGNRIAPGVVDRCLAERPSPHLRPSLGAGS
jgi:hypothetical protein